MDLTAQTKRPVSGAAPRGEAQVKCIHFVSIRYILGIFVGTDSVTSYSTPGIYFYSQADKPTLICPMTVKKEKNYLSIINLSSINLLPISVIYQSSIT
ncbi:hypothetical protein XELAEV_18036958mg [Xenopus laevis]|uniref:Uncharacterized protein n=1 Tax=Xenopus laevis TaxID=8355 RepID=A0A974CB53_XENLA|nr:hypothetical protein XELAEV_18036958mg [Xenopus laevis]